MIVRPPLHRFWWLLSASLTLAIATLFGIPPLRGVAQPAAVGTWVQFAPLPDTTGLATPTIITSPNGQIHGVPWERQADTRRIASFAFATAWPVDTSLFVLRQNGWILRTRDAGASWDVLPGPVQVGRESREQLQLADSPDGTRILFLINNYQDSLLYRSADEGTTWQPVLERPEGLPGTTRLDLVLSPDFARDGVALGVLQSDDLVGHSVLVRSSDAGVSWTVLDPAPGRALQGLVASPAFADDRMLMLTTRTALRPYWASKSEPLPDSPGLLVSTDGGETWEPRSHPLIDPSLFRVQPSPNFAQDTMLFGFTHDPTHYDLHALRSLDGGISWEQIPGLPKTTFSIAMSSNFAQDRLAIAASVRGLGHGSLACDFFRSTDGGMTWLALEFNPDEQDRFNGCSSPALLSAGGQVWGLIRSNHWYWSTDAGQHWTHLPLPSGMSIQQLAAMPGFSDTPALIAVTEDGQLWTLRLL